MKKILFASLIGFCAIFVSCTSTTELVRAAETSKYTDPIVVEQGSVVGIYSADNQVEIFAGIPYAKPPLGDLRWKEPQDCAKWEETLIANRFAPMSMQHQNSKFFNWLWNTFAMHSKGDRTDFAPMSEDCLYLNVWKPAGDKKKLPVLVYIHGGSLVGGSSFFSAFDGENMAHHDIIRVNIDYRTGIFGFIAMDELAEESPNLTTGNYGLLDQIKALEWVKENIESFGGDPENITIAGESAGSSCVSALCASPFAKGLFTKAIGTSSSVVREIPPHTFYTLNELRQKTKRVMVDLEVSSLQEMRKLPAKKLVKYTGGFNGMTVDGYVLPDYPWDIYKKGKNNEVALLNGFNEHEGFAFTFFEKINAKTYPKLVEKAFPGFADQILQLYPAKDKNEARLQYDKLFTANAFSFSHYTWSNAAMDNGVKVYEFYFTKNNKGIGTNHSGEMIYSYGNVPRLPNKDAKNYDESDYVLETQMMSYWINFAKTGNPNGVSIKDEKLPEWPMLNNDRTKVLELGTEIKVIDEPYLELYKILQSYADTLERGSKKNWDPR